MGGPDRNRTGQPSISRQMLSTDSESLHLSESHHVASCRALWALTESGRVTHRNGRSEIIENEGLV